MLKTLFYNNKGVLKLKYTRTKSKNRLLVNPESWGVNENTYGAAPEYYYDVIYTCLDCKKEVMWSAKDQKYWYEELGKNINSKAIRCQICRCHIQAIKEEQKRHMEKLL